MRFFLFAFILLVTGCSSKLLNTSQSLTVNLVGVDEAYCIIGNRYHRYALTAPGVTTIERGEEPLSIDCQGPANMRRKLTIDSHWDNAYYSYPDVVTVDFSKLDNGTMFNGYRAQVNPAHGRYVSEILTENSFSRPVETSQDYRRITAERSQPLNLNP